MNTCPCCKNGSVENFLCVSDLPMIIFPVHMGIRHDVPRKDIASYLCKTCGHIFTESLSSDDSEIIYEWLYDFYPFGDLESMNSHYRKPFENFFSSVNEEITSMHKNCDLLEIGCSSVEWLSFFKKFGHNSRGIDPGVPVDNESSKLVKGYYEMHELSEPVDILVSRFVLEHVNSASEFLSKNFNDLRNDGISFIQVPNIMGFVDEFIPLFLAHEHTNYFNLNSLNTAIRLAGFEIEDYRSGGASLIMAVSKKNRVTDNSLSIDISENLNDVFRKLNNYLLHRESIAGEVIKFINSRNDICFYGAGLCLSWILYELGFAEKGEFGSVVDDNELVRGLFMPNSDLKIFGFDEFKWNKCSSVLLTLNSMYHNNVVSKLRKHGFNGEIFAITNSGLSECN